MVSTTEDGWPADDFKCPQCGFRESRSHLLALILEPYRKKILRYTQALKEIDAIESRRMYETCPDCFQPDVCSIDKRCASMHKGTITQQLIAEALKE